MELSKEYSILFNGISATIVELEELLEKLKNLQQQAEETYVNEMCSIELPELRKSV